MDMKRKMLLWSAGGATGIVAAAVAAYALVPDRHGHGGPREDFAPTAPQASAGTAPRHGWATADANGDGALDLREFYARQSVRTARADTDRNGTLSAQELAAASERRGRRHGIIVP